MKFKVSCLILLTVLTTSVSYGKATRYKPTKKPRIAKLQFSEAFVLEQVLLKKNLTLRPEIPKPKLFVESKTKLSYFQDAIFPQWGFKPTVYTNAFAVIKNEIFLIDDAAYYKKHKRCMDDSLAHELVHYVQTKYQNYDLNDESLEFEAIDIQSWFREVHCKL